MLSKSTGRKGAHGDGGVSASDPRPSGGESDSAAAPGAIAAKIVGKGAATAAGSDRDQHA